MENDMSNAKHTPTPWRVIEGNLIKQDYTTIGLDETAGVLIGSTRGHPSSGFYPTEEEGAANAAFIVRAVNSHEQMVAALRDAESLIDTLALACIDRVDSVNDPRRATITAALSAVEA
jgi:hypothetical protein